MKKALISLLAIMAVSAANIAGQTASISALGGNTGSKTTSKITYHAGPVLTGVRNVYFIFYGCWSNTCGTAGDPATIEVLTNFITSIGNTPYMQINSTYPDGNGQAPTGSLIYGGWAYDTSYSHGVELTSADVTAIISDKINSFELPQDPNGIYIVFGSADVSANALGFCTVGAPAYHDVGIVNGSQLVYSYLGNPVRCPMVAGGQYVIRTGSVFTTPNESFSGDTMITNLAHVLNATLTDPFGNGWYDRSGLENSDKCTGIFGTTFTTANGARANINVGGHAYLLEENWLNDRKPHCAMYQ